MREPSFQKLQKPQGVNSTQNTARLSDQRVHPASAARPQTASPPKEIQGREKIEVHIDGRVVFDMIVVIQREQNLSSYSLNAVSAEYLGEQKEDVHYSQIGDLFKTSAETRRRLAIYCLKDAFLPMQLMDKLLCMYNYVEMARVTGVPINFLLNRGQMIKAWDRDA